MWKNQNRDQNIFDLSDPASEGFASAAYLERK